MSGDFHVDPIDQRRYGGGQAAAVGDGAEEQDRGPVQFDAGQAEFALERGNAFVEQFQPVRIGRDIEHGHDRLVRTMVDNGLQRRNVEAQQAGHAAVRKRNTHVAMVAGKPGRCRQATDDT